MIVLRRVLRRHDAAPAAGFKTRDGIANRRHVRQLRHARRGGDAERAQLAGLDMADARRDAADAGHELAAEQVGHHLVLAHIGHVNDVDAGHHLEQFDGEIRRRAGGRRADAELAGIGLGIGDEAGDVLRLKRRVHFQHQRDAIDGADRRGVAREVVRQVGEQRRVHGIGRRGEEQRVAVRRGVDDRLGAEIAAGAGLVLDHDGLAERIAQPLRCDPRGDVDLAAGGEADDQADRMRRIGLRPGDARRQRQRGGAGGQMQKSSPLHCSPGLGAGKAVDASMPMATIY